MDDEYATIRYIIYIDSLGNMQQMDSMANRLPLYESSDGNFRNVQNKGFFWGDYGAGGSGWSTFLYSVKDNHPYALDLSGKIQGFYYSEKVKKFVTTENDFTNGHSYPEVELIYDEINQEFVLGERI